MTKYQLLCCYTQFVLRTADLPASSVSMCVCLFLVADCRQTIAVGCGVISSHFQVSIISPLLDVASPSRTDRMYGERSPQSL